MYVLKTLTHHTAPMLVGFSDQRTFTRLIDASDIVSQKVYHSTDTYYK